ncbi:unnamed protein product [Mycena citricolor]|uniref:Uncharacterized protein n=1 Tax=Mycena citricolor TaxID=2018698 RepID=A0AAD2JU03_9AGAR|nr:unnamed protein product [Mycena citricolor]
MQRAAWPLISPRKPSSFYLRPHNRTFVATARYFNLSDGLDEVNGSSLVGALQRPSPKTTSLETDSLPQKAHLFDALSSSNSALQGLPQSSLDILAQVDRTLPAILGEVETDSTSIFEDCTSEEYTVVVNAFHPPAPTSSQTLESLVSQEQDYTRALRLLDELQAVGTIIPRSPIYADAAVAVLNATPKTEDEAANQVHMLTQWVSLLPGAEAPEAFRSVWEHLCTSTLDSVRVYSALALLGVEKGFANEVSATAMRLISTQGDLSSIKYGLEEIPIRHERYLKNSRCTQAIPKLVSTLRTQILSVAIQTLAREERFDDAIQLVPDPLETNLHATPYAYNYLIHKLRATKNDAYLPYIQFVAQHKSVARLKSTAIRRCHPEQLGLCIRSLAHANRTDLATVLLEEVVHLRVPIGLRTYTFLLERLRAASGDDVVIQRIAELAESAQPDDSSQSPDFDYGKSVQVLTRCWSLDDALALVYLYHQNTPSPLRSILNKLLWRLSASFDPAYAKDIARLTKLAKPPSKSVPEPSLQYCLSLKAGQTSASDLAAYLRLLKARYQAPNPHGIPQVHVVSHFLHLCLASDRLRAISLLRSVAFKRKASRLSFIIGQMVYQERCGRPDLVLRIFASHFHLSGVPRDSVLLQLSHLPEVDPADSIWISRRQVKLHPRPEITAVVWRALLKLIQDHSSLENLYRSLLGAARTGNAESPVQAGGMTTVPLRIHPHAMTPFIRRLEDAFGGDRGVQAVREMIQAGVRPTIGHWTELGRLYARRGDVKQVMTVLDQVELSATQNLLELDVTFYANLIRALLDRNSVREAQIVEQRLLASFEHRAEPESSLSKFLHSLRRDIQQAQVC